MEKNDKINKLLGFYRKEWESYDKSLLIEQCYDLNYKTKKDIAKLNKKTKDEIIELLIASDKANLDILSNQEIDEELKSFSICLY